MPESLIHKFRSTPSFCQYRTNGCLFSMQFGVKLPEISENRPDFGMSPTYGSDSKTFTKWDAAEHLRRKEDVRLYLEACAEEDPGDGSLIRAALNDIARAQNMSLLSRDVGMSREGLYKALSEKGNPSFATVIRITRALGMQLRITV